MDDYFEDAKKSLENKIPEFPSKNFEKLRDRIRHELKKKETEHLILVRRLKILILGDWYNEEKKQLLCCIKNTLLKNGLYAETIDNYYDMTKKGGLSQIQILETCCIKHQLIVFIDGEGKGTLSEQSYLADNYPLHGKILYFVEELKFDSLKDKPSEYIKDFPTIIIYKKLDLIDKILVFSRFRIYRLAEIIQKQSSYGKGLKNPKYEPWSKRLLKGIRKH